MKLSAITIAIILAGTAGIASAAGQDKVMPRINVQAAGISACTPPSDAPACAEFHRWIRANFSRREIGMLFGASTAYPEYLTGGIDRLQRRYQVMLQQYVAAHSAVNAGADVAAK
ncbi:MAG TPA: hypothetical protein VIC31_06870 [Rudaea sp.]|jgi:uncharacterized NAD(P)/FAD-binding protein YdhS